MQQRLPSLRDTTILFAHRGARAHSPENTIEAFNLALRLGATGLETDAWLTSDGAVVLDHDGVVRRRWRTQSMSQLRRDELPPHIPSLDEFFDRCTGQFDLSIDVKDAECFGHIVDVARASHFPLDKLWLCHPDYRVLQSQRKRMPDVRLVDSTRLSKISEGPERRLSTLRDSGVDCINMHQSDWNGGLVTLAHKFGRLAFGWDAQHEEILDRSLRMGLDGVYSDHTDRMVDAALRIARREN